MPAGGPGDEPLLDILHYKIPVYGDEADELIRKIAALSSPGETTKWWGSKIGWLADPEDALKQARLRYEEVLKRAVDSGWELPDSNRETTL